MKIIRIIFLSVQILLLINLSLSASEIKAFVSDGLKEPMEEIAQTYKEKFNINIILTFSGSRELLNRILSGDIPDIFIPGDEYPYENLLSKKLVDSAIYIAYHTPVLLISNRCEECSCFIDIIKTRQLAIGDENETSIGYSFMKTLEKLGLSSSDVSIVSKGKSNAQVVDWAVNDYSDAAYVWKVDTKKIDSAKIVFLPDSINSTERIPVSTLRPGYSINVYNFRNYICTQGLRVFEKYGFDMIQE